jgi:hypothetical protein
MIVVPRQTRQPSQYYKETNVTSNNISMIPTKEKEGHACTNQKKRYAGRSNCYNPQLHESG